MKHYTYIANNSLFFTLNDCLERFDIEQENLMLINKLHTLMQVVGSDNNTGQNLLIAKIVFTEE